MVDHRRTAIRRLSARRYRSLKEVVLENLPDLVVLFGPNGVGKSNILRAAELALKAASRSSPLPSSREQAVSLPLLDADKELGLRPDDFRHGDLPEIRIDLELSLGTRAEEIVLPPEGQSLARLELESVFQLGDDRSIRYWFTGAAVDQWNLREPVDPDDRRSRQKAAELRQQHDQQRLAQADLRNNLAELERIRADRGTLDAGQQSTKATLEAALSASLAQSRETESALRKLEASLSEKSLLLERIQGQLLPRLLQTSEAYRVPGGPRDPQRELFGAMLSENPRERDAAGRLGERLARASLFGQAGGSVRLSPVDSQTFGEKQIRFQHPTHGELPLRNLGSGEQQVILMLAQRVITPFPVAHLEEPEAHLHRALMEPLATLLRESVAGEDRAPDVDQLWMATHHHYFAISHEFFDVSLDDSGQTVVKRLPRDQAASHFFEPGPYWDTLRGLVKEGMSPDTIVSIDAQGKPIHARDILASIEGDRRLANEFVNAATKAFVLGLADGGTDP